MSEEKDLPPVVDLSAYRDRKRLDDLARGAPAVTREFIDAVDARSWIEEVCLCVGDDGSAFVQVAPPNFVLPVGRQLLLYIHALVWTAIHAGCADCVAKRAEGWCDKHATSEQLLDEIDARIKHALAARNPT